MWAKCAARQYGGFRLRRGRPHRLLLARRNPGRFGLSVNFCHFRTAVRVAAVGHALQAVALAIFAEGIVRIIQFPAADLAMVCVRFHDVSFRVSIDLRTLSRMDADRFQPLFCHITSQQDIIERRSIHTEIALNQILTKELRQTLIKKVRPSIIWIETPAYTRRPREGGDP